MEPLQVLSLRVKVELGLMSVNEYLIVARHLEVEPHQRMQCHTQDALDLAT